MELNEGAGPVRCAREFFLRTRDAANQFTELLNNPRRRGLEPIVFALRCGSGATAISFATGNRGGTAPTVLTEQYWGLTLARRCAAQSSLRQLGHWRVTASASESPTWAVTHARSQACAYTALVANLGTNST